jgi:hypothetical protein
LALEIEQAPKDPRKTLPDLFTAPDLGPGGARGGAACRPSIRGTVDTERRRGTTTLTRMSAPVAPIRLSARPGAELAAQPNRAHPRGIRRGTYTRSSRQPDVMHRL